MQSSTSCTLPPISDLFILPSRSWNESTSDLNQQCHAINSVDTNQSENCQPRNHDTSISNNKSLGYHPTLKAKRKRASPSQLTVLNQVFSQTYFPSTELRIELGKHLGMSPRTVQIWFQNKRQSLRLRNRRYSFSSMEGGDMEIEEEGNMAANHYGQHNQYDITASSSLPCTPTSGSNFTGNEHDYFILPPPSTTPGSSSPMISSSSPIMKDDENYRHPEQEQKVNLPPLRLHQNSYYPPSPPSSTYSSPTSIDSILH